MRALQALCLLAMIMGVSVSADTPTRLPPLELTFGLYTSSAPSELVREFRPVIKALEQQMERRSKRDVSIKFKIASSYEEGVQQLVDGEVDFSRFGPASYVTAKARAPGLRLLAVESVNGAKEFYGIIATRRNSPIKALEDLRGRTFAFGSEESTIGRYLSQLTLANAGITADQLLNYRYTGRHDLAGQAVASGKVDAGALNERTFDKLVDRGLDLVELERFPNVTKPWIASGTVKQSTFTLLQTSLLSMPKESPYFESLGIDGFLPTVDADFDLIRESIEENSLFFEGPSPEFEVTAKAVYDSLTDSVRLVISLPPHIARGGQETRSLSVRIERD